MYCSEPCLWALNLDPVRVHRLRHPVGQQQERGPRTGRDGLALPLPVAHHAEEGAGGPEQDGRFRLDRQQTRLVAGGARVPRLRLRRAPSDDQERGEPVGDAEGREPGVDPPHHPPRVGVHLGRVQEEHLQDGRHHRGRHAVSHYVSHAHEDRPVGQREGVVEVPGHPVGRVVDSGDGDPRHRPAGLRQQVLLHPPGVGGGQPSAGVVLGQCPAHVVHRCRQCGEFPALERPRPCPQLPNTNCPDGPPQSPEGAGHQPVDGEVDGQRRIAPNASTATARSATWTRISCRRVSNRSATKTRVPSSACVPTTTTSA